MPKTYITIIIIIIASDAYWCTDRLQELSRHPDLGPASQVIIIIIIIASDAYWCTDRPQELSRHPDPGPASQVIIIINIIIIAFGPYRSTGRLQELSRHPDLGPASQVIIIIIITIIIIIIAFGPYWSIGRLRECLILILGQPFKLSSSSSSLPLTPTRAQTAHKSSPDILILGQPLKLSPGVTHPLFQPPDRGTRWFLSSSSFLWLFFFFPLLPPRWPSGQGVRLESGRSRVRIPLAPGFFRGRVIPVT